MKLRFKSVEDMEDASLLRRLLENDLPAEEAITIWKGAFPDIAIWSLEEMQEYLLQVFLFNPGEIDKLLQKYKNQIHKKVQPKRSMSPLPKFDKNDPNAIKMSKNYWEAMNHLKKAVNLLSVTTPVESNYENNDEYKPHRDLARLTGITWFYREPKKFTGGNLRFPEFDMEIECKHNRVIVFPSSIHHGVDKVGMEEKDMGKKLGRFTMTQFLSCAG